MTLGKASLRQQEFVQWRPVLWAHSWFLYCFIETNQWTQKILLPQSLSLIGTDQEKRRLWEGDWSWGSEVLMQLLEIKIKCIIIAEIFFSW